MNNNKNFGTLQTGERDLMQTEIDRLTDAAENMPVGSREAANAITRTILKAMREPSEGLANAIDRAEEKMMPFKHYVWQVAIDYLLEN